LQQIEQYEGLLQNRNALATPHATRQNARQESQETSVSSGQER
jgi:hypothetical protein